MKKMTNLLTMAIIAVAMVISLNLNATAADMCSPAAPVLDGIDVLFHDSFIRSAEGDGMVYAACNLNGWLQRPSHMTQDRLDQTALVHEGNCWRARGMKGVRFNVARINSGGLVTWAKIEDFWILPGYEGHDEFVVKGPALVVNK